MKIQLFATFKNYKLHNLPKDVFAGLIIAAMSIPIAMGYAQVAGLPAVYGLYGSVFSILFFAIFSTSPQFIFGVDAAPAALVGSALVTLGIENYSKEALELVPVITFFTACWLLLFFAFRAGKLVNYISLPVMGGFISGICFTIILMQVPKLMGSGAGMGEFFELSEHIYKALGHVNGLSLVLGLATLGILLVSKRFIPKFPMAVVMMIAGALITKIFSIEKHGVILLSSVDSGLPGLHVPNLSVLELSQGLGISLTIAIIIMAETLLSENNFAMKNSYKLNDNQELLAFCAGNLAAAFTGCCPVNGSVSRTAMGEQYGGKTQATSLVAGIAMIFMLLFGTGIIGYLPVPVMTAIVISALLSVIEFDLAHKLFKVSKKDFFIFVGAFMGVMILGTIYGVVIGIILSFVAVIHQSVEPPRDFLGVVPGRKGFHSFSRNKNARPIENTLIYRFSSSLFFANIKTFQDDIESQIKDDTKIIIIDGTGITRIDVSAAERLEMMVASLNDRGIRFYLTEHIAAMNDQLRTLGLGHLIEEGAVRRTITAALRDAGIFRPFPLEGVDYATQKEMAKSMAPEDKLVEEFEWAFGKDAEMQMQHQTERILNMAEKYAGDISLLGKLSKDDHRIDILWTERGWHGFSLFDEDELLEHLEFHLKELAKRIGESEGEILYQIEQRRNRLAKKLEEENPDAYQYFHSRRAKLEDYLKEENPEAYHRLAGYREEYEKKAKQ